MSVLSNKVSSMQARLNHLRETEENLDRLCKAMQENYKQARKSPSNEYFAYVTRDDLVDVFGKDSTILTVRNCDTIRQGKTKDALKQTLRVHGLWKKVDVRLVTNDGEVAQKTIQTSDETEMDGELSGVPKISSNQSESNNNASRKPGRRRKPERFELKEDDSSIEPEQLKRSKTNVTEEEKELLERRITAETLLGYRPPRVQRKRDLDANWLERKWKFFKWSMVVIHTHLFNANFSFLFPATPSNANQTHPLIQLSPPRSKYTYTLRRTEGICDLFMGGAIPR